MPRLPSDFEQERDVFAPMRPSRDEILRAQISEVEAASAMISQAVQTAEAAEAVADDAQDTAEEALARAPGENAWSFPKYLVAALPLAADYPEATVRVRDNPKGFATSTYIEDDNLWHWMSEVDGSDLGPGNAPSP